MELNIDTTRDVNSIQMRIELSETEFEFLILSYLKISNDNFEFANSIYCQYYKIIFPVDKQNSTVILIGAFSVAFSITTH